MENTYVFYIQYFRDPSSNSLVTSERRLYSVPISEEDAQYALTEPSIKTQMSKAGSFEFSITPSHPYYDAWLQMKTMMRVEYAGETIFRGRVLTIDTSPMANGAKKIHLEGDFAFLMDSLQEGKKEEDRDEISLEDYIIRLLDNHNSQMSGDGYKKIYRGLVPGNYGSVSGKMRISGGRRKYGENSWRSTSDALSSLQSEFGGYFRTRYVKSEGKCYLDWLDRYFSDTVSSQHIEITENLIDLTSVTEVDNLFTALVPVGSNESKSVYISDSRKYITVPEVAQWYIDQGRGDELDDIYHSRYEYLNAISNYGVIYKTQNFSNADTAEKLQEYAYDWVKNNFVGGIDSFTVSALDFRHLDTSKRPFMVGDLVRCIYPNPTYRTKGGNPTIEKVLAITSAQYKPHTPDQNSYSIGIPSTQLSNKTYGTAKAKASNSGGGGGGASVSDITAGGGGGIADNEYETKLTADEVDYYAWKYVIDARKNNKKYQELVEDGFYEEAQKASWVAWAAAVRGITLDDDDPEYRELNTKVDMVLFDGPKATIKVYDKLPKAIQEYVTQHQDDPITHMTRQEKKALEAAVEIACDAQVSKMSIDDKVKISGAAVYNDTYIASLLVHDKKDRRTAIDIGVEVGLLKNNYQPWESNPYVHMSKVYKGLISEEDPAGVAGSYPVQSVATEGQQGISMAMKMATGAQAFVESITGLFDGTNNKITFVSKSDAGNLTDAKAKLSGMPDTGFWGAIKMGLGVDNSAGGNTTMDFDGKKSIIKTRSPLKAGSTDNEDLTTSINGDTGKTTVKELGVGKNGYNKDTVTILGDTSKIKTRRPLNAGSTDEKDTTTEIDGDQGTASVGKEKTDPTQWAITLNRPITYYDEEEKPHTLTGSIHAADFHVDEIGSFKTKLGVFDELITARATIGELDVERARIGDLELTTEDLDERTDVIEGSALWVKRDHITGVTGDFRIDKDASGNDILTIISGGGMKIERDSVAYGIYDNGNLTGGIMVDKINDKTTTTKIIGDRVDIEAKQVRIGDTSNVETWMGETGETLDEYSGLIAARATIYQLSTMRADIEEIFADYISAEDMKTYDLQVANISADTGVFNTSIVAPRYSIYGKGEFDNVLVSASVSDNILTITDVSGATVTFSKATSLSAGTWSGGKVTVKATPQDETLDILINKEVEIKESATGKSYIVTSKLNVDNVTYNQVSTDSGTGVYDNGWKAASKSVTYTDGATYVTVPDETSGKTKSLYIAKTYEAGYNSARLSRSWIGKNCVVGIIPSGDDRTLSFSIDADISYDKDTHKYTAKANADGDERNTKESGTEAWDAGRLSGWNTGASNVSRDGNKIYGPLINKIGEKTLKFTATFNPATYTASSYTKESHSYTASSYTKETHSYTASSYTKESHSYSPSSYTKESVSYKGSSHVKIGNSCSYVASSYSHTASKYTASSHSYTASKYTASSHSYTASKYTASSFKQGSISWS